MSDPAPVLNPASQTCGECLFWGGEPAAPYGPCRRHAPRGANGVNFAMTSHADWCGDFQLKPPGP